MQATRPRAQEGGHPAPVDVSRRSALCHLGRIAVGSAAVTAASACARLPSYPGDAENDDVALARFLSDTAPHIAARSTPYRLTRSLIIPAGKTITLAAGTRIVWAGPSSRDGKPLGVFEAGGDHTGIQVVGGEAIIECERPSSSIYAAVMRGRRGFSVVGIQARDCQHVLIEGGSAGRYDGVRTSETGGNVARDIHISGGGASYATPQTSGDGACKLAYVVGALVEEVQYRNVPHGIQWWGGDAGTEPWQNGARANERKCRDVLIRNASISRAHVGGIWGSMGRNIVVRDCLVEECLDVGFDAEGCVDTLFERCTARNGHNGCFATFSLCERVRFTDCRGIADRKEYPLLRIYNATQSNAENRDIAVSGGTFECLDRTGPGVMDCAMGPVQDIAITGATLTNVRIDLAFFNMHRTRVTDNTLTFPYPLPSVAAIRAGSSKSITGAATAVPGGATVENNRIRYTATPTQGKAVAIQVREDDFNSSASGTIVGNVVTGPFATGISLVNASGNVGVVPSFSVQSNRFRGLVRGAHLLHVVQEGAHAARPVVRWDGRQTRDGRIVSLAGALS